MEYLKSLFGATIALTLVGCNSAQVQNDPVLIDTHIMVALNDIESGQWIDHEMIPIKVTSPDEDPFERKETIVAAGSYGEGVHFAASTNDKLEDKYLKVFNSNKSDSVYLYVLFTNSGLGNGDTQIQFGIDRETGDILNLDNYNKSPISYKVMSKDDVFSELEIE